MRVLAIVNLSAGQADAGLYQFLRAIGRAGAEVTLRFVSGGTTTRDLVRDAEEFDRVVAAGGDGTVSSVCYETRGRGVPIIAYPAGTANLLALNLGMPIDPSELAHLALAGHVIDADLGELEIGESGDPTRFVSGFVVAAGAGFDAKIMEGAQDLKPTIGAAAYLVGVMQNLAPTVSRFEITIDGAQTVTEGMAVLLVNFARLQFDISITHHSDPSDGVFEIVVLKSKNVAELIPAVWAAIIDRTTGAHPGRSAGLEIFSGKEVQVVADPPLPVQSDGDVLGAMTPFRARVLPSATRLVVSEAYLRRLGR